MISNHTMRYTNYIRIIVLGVVICGTYLVLQASRPRAGADACKESVDECCKKHEKGDGGMIWENISHQFFSSL